MLRVTLHWYLYLILFKATAVQQFNGSMTVNLTNPEDVKTTNKNYASGKKASKKLVNQSAGKKTRLLKNENTKDSKDLVKSDAKTLLMKTEANTENMLGIDGRNL